MLPWPRWCAQTPPGWRACWAASQPPQLTWPVHPRRCLLARRAQEPRQLCCVLPCSAPGSVEVTDAVYHQSGDARQLVLC